ncbi:carboxymuconolactone decarboxylase family protein [Chloroflexota bacterium]
MMIRYAPVRELGLTEERIRQLDNYRDGDFSDREKLALEFTELYCTAPNKATDDFFDRLKAHFTEKEIAELAFAVISYHGLHRFNVLIDVEPINPNDLTYLDKRW